MHDSHIWLKVWTDDNRKATTAPDDIHETSSATHFLDLVAQHGEPLDRGCAFRLQLGHWFQRLFLQGGDKDALIGAHPALWVIFDQNGL